MFSVALEDLKDEEATQYFKEIGKSFCPFISPSKSYSTLRFSRFKLQGDFNQVQVQVFYVGLLLTEYLRLKRHHIDSMKVKMLMCENAIFDFPSDLTCEGEKIFEWPHWVLKLLYLNAAVVYGKFWLGEKTNDRQGCQLPLFLNTSNSKN